MPKTVARRPNVFKAIVYDQEVCLFRKPQQKNKRELNTFKLFSKNIQLSQLMSVRDLAWSVFTFLLYKHCVTVVGVKNASKGKKLYYLSVQATTCILKCSYHLHQEHFWSAFIKIHNRSVQ